MFFSNFSSSCYSSVCLFLFSKPASEVISAPALQERENSGTQGSRAKARRTIHTARCWFIIKQQIEATMNSFIWKVIHIPGNCCIRWRYETQGRLGSRKERVLFAVLIAVIQKCIITSRDWHHFINRVSTAVKSVTTRVPYYYQLE